ncbi:hypothetical protein ACP6H4_01985 [Vibrio harveyi]|uniref:hypothetical protein n=1 Tax=Vibrio harveyi TaxID=669 RepID=UPI003CF94742
MSFKAIIQCDAIGCNAEMQLDCEHPADAEILYESLNDDTEWLVDFVEDHHYCPKHSIKKNDELLAELETNE